MFLQLHHSNHKSHFKTTLLLWLQSSFPSAFADYISPVVGLILEAENVCMTVFICMCVCVYMHYIFLHICTHIYIYIYLCFSICTCACCIYFHVHHGLIVHISVCMCVVVCTFVHWFMLAGVLIFVYLDQLN